jgi:hypothetical protein
MKENSRQGEMTFACNNLVGKSKGRPGRIRDDTIKLDLKETGREVMPLCWKDLLNIVTGNSSEIKLQSHFCFS